MNIISAAMLLPARAVMSVVSSGYQLVRDHLGVQNTCDASDKIALGVSNHGERNPHTRESFAQRLGSRGLGGVKRHLGQGIREAVHAGVSRWSPKCAIKDVIMSGINTKSRKGFNDIADAYVFFQQHSSEEVAIRSALARYLVGIQSRFSEGINILDFGSGDGKMLAGLIEATELKYVNLKITVVDPVASYLRDASTHLDRFTRDGVTTLKELSRAKNQEPYNLIICNHVLYYVTDLEMTVRNILANVDSVSEIYVIMADDSENSLLQFWINAFRRLNIPLPYNMSKDFEGVLGKKEISYQKKQMTSQLTFPDTEENRIRILRFLLGDYSRGNESKLLSFFDQHTDGETITMPLIDNLYVIKPR